MLNSKFLPPVIRVFKLFFESHTYLSFPLVSVNATEGGRDAILQLADGDLRRVLNLLQSTSMAYPQVTQDNVYLTAGAAMPSVIEAIFVSLMNQPFEQAYRTLLQVSVTAAFLFLVVALLLLAFG